MHAETEKMQKKKKKRRRRITKDKGQAEEDKENGKLMKKSSSIHINLKELEKCRCEVFRLVFLYEICVRRRRSCSRTISGCEEEETI